MAGAQYLEELKIEIVKAQREKSPWTNILPPTSVSGLNKNEKANLN
jgi:hypothetical protein